MKKHLSDPRNPGVYSLLVRTGMVDRVKKRCLSDEAEDLFRRHVRAAALLYEDGVLTSEGYDDAVSRIRRIRAAAVLKAYRQSAPLTSRIKEISKLRQFCPTGMTSYDIRMGRGHV